MFKVTVPEADEFPLFTQVRSCVRAMNPEMSEADKILIDQCTRLSPDDVKIKPLVEFNPADGISPGTGLFSRGPSVAVDLVQKQLYKVLHHLTGPRGSTVILSADDGTILNSTDIVEAVRSGNRGAASIMLDAILKTWWTEWKTAPRTRLPSNLTNFFNKTFINNGNVVSAGSLYDNVLTLDKDELVKAFKKLVSKEPIVFCFREEKEVKAETPVETLMILFNSKGLSNSKTRVKTDLAVENKSVLSLVSAMFGQEPLGYLGLEVLLSAGGVLERWFAKNQSFNQSMAHALGTELGEIVLACSHRVDDQKVDNIVLTDQISKAYVERRGPYGLGRLGVYHVLNSVLKGSLWSRLTDSDDPKNNVYRHALGILEPQWRNHVSFVTDTETRLSPEAFLILETSRLIRRQDDCVAVKLFRPSRGWTGFKSLSKSETRLNALVSLMCQGGAAKSKGVNAPTLAQVAKAINERSGSIFPGGADECAATRLIVMTNNECLSYHGKLFNKGVCFTVPATTTSGTTDLVFPLTTERESIENGLSAEKKRSSSRRVWTVEHTWTNAWAKSGRIASHLVYDGVSGNTDSHITLETNGLDDCICIKVVMNDEDEEMVLETPFHSSRHMLASNSCE
jgi:hypothetical protein